jgi:hypothetical protein
VGGAVCVCVCGGGGELGMVLYEAVSGTTLVLKYLQGKYGGGSNVCVCVCVCVSRGGGGAKVAGSAGATDRGCQPHHHHEYSTCFKPGSLRIKQRKQVTTKPSATTTAPASLGRLRPSKSGGGVVVQCPQMMPCQHLGKWQFYPLSTHPLTRCLTQQLST